MRMSIYRSARFKFMLSLAAISYLLVGCGERQSPMEAKPPKSAEYQQQISELTAERDCIKAEVQEL